MPLAGASRAACDCTACAWSCCTAPNCAKNVCSTDDGASFPLHAAREKTRSASLFMLAMLTCIRMACDGRICLHAVQNAFKARSVTSKCLIDQRVESVGLIEHHEVLRAVDDVKARAFDRVDLRVPRGLELRARHALIARCDVCFFC